MYIVILYYFIISSQMNRVLNFLTLSKPLNNIIDIITCQFIVIRWSVMMRRETSRALLSP